MDMIVPLFFLFFLLPGLAYGIVAGSIRSDRDVVQGMSQSIGAMGYYLVLAFFASQFIAAFRESNVGALLSLKGAKFLAGLHLSGAVVLAGVVILTTLLDLVIGSASAKWAVMAPVLVPMLMQVGIEPEWTQAAFRVGASCANVITPLMPYFPLTVLYCRRYVPSTGVGTVVAMMLPYSITFLTTWTALLVAYWAAGLPLGIR
jgi:aminobenzoyl-glutamate transport protein